MSMIAVTELVLAVLCFLSAIKAYREKANRECIGWCVAGIAWILLLTIHG